MNAYVCTCGPTAEGTDPCAGTCLGAVAASARVQEAIRGFHGAGSLAGLLGLPGPDAASRALGALDYRSPEAREGAKRRSRAPLPSWIRVVRERPSEYEREVAARGICRTASLIHELLRERLCAEVCEVMVVVMLDGRNRVIGMSEVSRGGLHGCAVSARDVLRPAVAGGASAMVLVHNHPSGDPSPSEEDVEFTKRIMAAAAIVGVPLVDHVIIGSWERFASLLTLGIGGFES